MVTPAESLTRAMAMVQSNARPKPHIKPKVNTSVGTTYPVLGIEEAEGGFVISNILSSDCWSCGNLSRKFKPGTTHHLWKCDACQVRWKAPALPQGGS